MYLCWVVKHDFLYYFIVLLLRSCVRGIWRDGDPEHSSLPVPMARHKRGLFQHWLQLPDLCHRCHERLFCHNGCHHSEVSQPKQEKPAGNIFFAHIVLGHLLDYPPGHQSLSLRLWVHEQPRSFLGANACENGPPLVLFQLQLFLQSFQIPATP